MSDLEFLVKICEAATDTDVLVMDIENPREKDGSAPIVCVWFSLTSDLSVTIPTVKSYWGKQLDAVWERQHKQREYAKYGWARRQVLSEVAWHFAVVGQFGAFPEMELLDVLATQCAPGQPFAGRQPEDILDELSLLVSVEAAPMRQRQFLVRLFQEYFAAQGRPEAVEGAWPFVPHALPSAA